jgi:hypothetical protein
VAIYQYIAAAASPNIAERFTNAIVSYCEGLTDIRKPNYRSSLAETIAVFLKQYVIEFDSY